MNVVITGANRGIGLALTNKYLESGANVYALCRRASAELEKTSAKIIEGVNVTDFATLKNVSTQIEGSVDILINNAGVWSDENIESLSEEDFVRFSETLEINTIAPLKVTSAFLGKMTSGSKVGIVTSRMGSIADNDSGSRYSYRSSKAAVNAVGKSLAIDLSESGISVALLHPGFVQTDMTGGKGLITTQQSAEGLYQRMEELNLKNSGTFWHSNGEVLPW
jgi:NAD(P)-dependent dehydrogenase (short-subunit alcohol dehydrogenase family)